MSDKIYGKKLLGLIPKIDFMLENVFCHSTDTTPVNTKDMYDFMMEIRDTISEETSPAYQMNARHEARTKPPPGCSPYYVSISARICELCEAIKRYSTETGKNNQIKLWAHEIFMLNEMDRHLRRTEKEKVWAEKENGTIEEI